MFDGKDCLLLLIILSELGETLHATIHLVIQSDLIPERLAVGECVQVKIHSS
jgi:hypothetical protein